eukprot:TRINITY_DN60902_c0_g1_i1.p1 TRINITY_DN60902_c0_g1~~TRINITY_DN60902_c0_g1_i1.p1  ORF type:complete len:314 (+),score=91.51 TRINITY_DN60902_c0_g1_i1:91-942(+)
MAEKRAAEDAAPAGAKRPRSKGGVMQQLSLEGKIAVVTGGSRGLGLAMARGLAEAGALVVLTGRTAADLDKAVAAFQAEGLKASREVFDVTVESAVVAAVKRICDAHGRIDILVNNAGGTRRSPFLESTVADLDHVINLNLRGPYIVAREVGKVMKSKGYGRIINIASLNAVQCRATLQPYNATKHAVVGLTKGLACELGPHGITCNAIGPGYFATELTAPLMKNPDFNKCIKTRTPVGRWGDPADLAGAAVFLASDASTYVNGHLLMVDGGMTTALCDSLLP